METYLFVVVVVVTFLVVWRKTKTLRLSSDVSLAQYIELGKYDVVNKEINEKNFSARIREKYTIKYKLFRADKFSLSSQFISSAKQNMKKEGFEFGNVYELAKLGVEIIQSQKKIKYTKIIALDSVWRDDNKTDHFPVLCLDFNWRRLLLASKKDIEYSAMAFSNDRETYFLGIKR